jgi:hypothetical protein
MERLMGLLSYSDLYYSSIVQDSLWPGETQLTCVYCKVYYRPWYVDLIIRVAESSVLGWFLEVSLMVQVSSINRAFRHFSPNFSNSADDSPDRTASWVGLFDRIEIVYHLSHQLPGLGPTEDKTKKIVKFSSGQLQTSWREQRTEVVTQSR